ncbi:circumsporozoite protein-like [Panicum hallii]|jgi:hypothetical protein|uniref:circumsporozoite protein-like n=1 Tax=Panicum hallii TaxID=206008 RepID=UPI000DF4E65E|nr:circumsporozoite protein-like [Panicum hallii]
MENDNFMKNKILCGVLRESITSQQERATASWRQTTGRVSSLDARGAPLGARTSLPGVLRESPCLRSGCGQGAGVECLGEGRAPAESSTVRATAGPGGNLLGGRASLGGGPVLQQLVPGWRRAPGRLGDGGGQAGLRKVEAGGRRQGAEETFWAGAPPWAAALCSGDSSLGGGGHQGSCEMEAARRG